VKSLEQSAQDNPPDIIGLASNLDLDNELITFIIFFLAKYFNDKYGTETYFIMNFNKIMTTFNVFHIL
jgi:hypothetical protein